MSCPSSIRHRQLQSARQPVACRPAQKPRADSSRARLPTKEPVAAYSVLGAIFHCTSAHRGPLPSQWQFPRSDFSPVPSFELDARAPAANNLPPPNFPLATAIRLPNSRPNCGWLRNISAYIASCNTPDNYPNIIFFVNLKWVNSGSPTFTDASVRWPTNILHTAKPPLQYALRRPHNAEDSQNPAMNAPCPAAIWPVFPS